MTDFPGDMTWVAALIPDLEARSEMFTVDTDEVDDDLIEVFVEEIRRLSGELEEGLSQADYERLRTAAHSIKGMGGTVGLPSISVLALEIENMAKENDLAATEPLITGLAQWMATLA